MGQGQKTVRTPVRAIANLLADIAPEQLDRLRREFPDQKEIFDTFHVLGGEPSETILSGAREIDALRTFAEAGITAVESKLPRIIQALIYGIKRARITKLVGAIMASVSSVGVISALTLNQRQVAMATAVVGLISSTASIIGEHLDRPLVGNHKGLGDLLASALGAEAKVADLRVSLLAGSFGSPEGAVTLAGKVNELAAQVHEIVVFGGVAA
jgi:hypothetical protein